VVKCGNCDALSDDSVVEDSEDRGYVGLLCLLVPFVTGDNRSQLEPSGVTRGELLFYRLARLKAAVVSLRRRQTQRPPTPSAIRTARCHVTQTPSWISCCFLQYIIWATTDESNLYLLGSVPEDEPEYLPAVYAGISRQGFVLGGTAIAMSVFRYVTHNT
jgi:hypothetical protein